jgi:microcystin-dependent protein
MATPYLSELRLVSFNFAPKNWTQCNGNLLPINQWQALFALLGTTYGGDGRVNFGLPNLQGRVPLSVGPGYVLGQNAGEYNHTLILQEMPAHNHMLQGVNVTENQFSPSGNMLANTTGSLTVYGPFASQVPMFGGDIANNGGSQPHNNMQPYLVMNWIIALQGIFPSQN